ncbi:hypothetical protein [Pontibacter sp. G13]|uniref:DNA-3-methyladenine glycosylase family protein n=1 Tax=Pontibacter sp. G13 TaxID=3074898 RepID=UPI00288B107D|nr:hypothetical protein [Pontibacter sp. G13]WNJ18786.1 hypothetical protein RJD25_28350 [Pontibacter sp. G13]
MQEQIRQHLMDHDEHLAPIVEQLPFPQIISTGSVFHDLMSCVIEQQIHYRSTKRTFERLLERANLTLLTPDSIPQFEERALGTIKLSGRKIETMERVIDFFSHPEPDWTGMTDEAVRETLGGIKGIGPWTVDMILLYTLQRPNVFPVGDFHLKKLMTALYEIDPSRPLAKEMKQIAELWRPYQSFGVLYVLEWKKQQSKR